MPARALFETVELDILNVPGSGFAFFQFMIVHLLIMSPFFFFRDGR